MCVPRFRFSSITLHVPFADLQGVLSGRTEGSRKVNKVITVTHSLVHFSAPSEVSFTSSHAWSDSRSLTTFSPKDLHCELLRCTASRGLFLIPIDNSTILIYIFVEIFDFSPSKRYAYNIVVGSTTASKKLSSRERNDFPDFAGIMGQDNRNVVSLKEG